jgi:hypothetical protein
MSRDKETHVVMKRAIINPDNQEPLWEVGAIYHLNDAVRICDIWGVDHFDAWFCANLEVAQYAAANYFDNGKPL